jgi:hypothetical protein
LITVIAMPLCSNEGSMSGGKGEEGISSLEAP